MKTMLRISLIVTLILTVVGGAWLAVPISTEARGTSWSVSVYNNPDVIGNPVWVGLSPAVSYSWGSGAPVINGVSTGAPVDNFSVKFVTTAFFTAGTYRFTVQVDDGARLYVDGLLLINGWQSGLGLRTLQADYTFVGDGNHTITVEMFDAVGDATIVASWAVAVGVLPTPTKVFVGTPWYAEFFNGLDLSGGVVFTNTYPPSGINQNWGQGSPGGVVPADNWSARFTRTLNVPSDLPEGEYTFYARADDNFRFYVDNTVIFDYWDVFANSELYSAQVTLLNGPHTLKFEYREREVDALLFLTWDPPNAQDPVISPSEAGGPSTGGGNGGGGVVPGQPTLTATVSIATLNFRASPSLTAPILAKLNQGASYPATGRTADNQWVRLSVDGGSGWVYAQYVSLSGDINTLPVVEDAGYTPPPIQPTGVRGQVLGNLRIRAEPTTRSAQIGLMPWGTEIDLLGKNGGHSWYLLQYGDVVGWSYAPWIRIIAGAFDQLPYMDGTEPQFQPPPATQGVVAQAFGNMRIRSGPGLQFPKVGRAVWGSRVEVLARSTNGLWYKVRYGDVVGWSYATWYRIVQGEITTVPVSDQ